MLQNRFLLKQLYVKRGVDNGYLLLGCWIREHYLLLSLLRKSYLTPFKNLSLFCHIQLWIILRPHCEHFSLKLLSTTETVFMKTADRLFCGLPSVTAIMLLGKDVAVVIFLVLRQICQTWTNKTQTIAVLDSIRVRCFKVTQFVYVRVGFFLQAGTTKLKQLPYGHLVSLLVQLNCIFVSMWDGSNWSMDLDFFGRFSVILKVSKWFFIARHSLLFHIHTKTGHICRFICIVEQ